MKLKPKKLFWMLFPSYLFISLIGLVVLLIITRFAFQNFYYQQTTNSLVQKAKIIESELIEDIQFKNYKSLQVKINLFSKKAENRISVILPSGKVISDSHYDPSKMENHKDRKEVQTALEGEIGKSIRFSETLKNKHLYIALPILDDTKILGVLRNSVSVDKLHLPLYLLIEKILIWSFLLVLILTYFIYYQTKKISGPLEEVKDKLEKFAQGDFEEEIKIDETTTAEITSLFSSIQSMSEKIQKQVKKINKQKNEQLAVFSSMLEGVITIYPDMNIYHINEAALSLFNYPEEMTVKGIPLHDVVKSERIFKMAKVLLEDHKTVDNEFEYQSGLILNVHGTILESKETGMLGAVLVFNDITKVRELENHRKQFVANVSHELKTPLTAIQGYLETIREGDIDDKEVLNKFLGIINKHSTRLKKIIEDLLELSFIERESEFSGLELINSEIAPLLENVIFLCTEKSRAKSINIELHAQEIRAMLNPPLFEQAIINLVDNAIKYAPEKSTVTISIEKVGSKVEISVADEGAGIEVKHHERLFERFYSVDKARSRELGGSGLGLSIVKHIALSHGGNVRVESVISEGSTFTFEVPVLLNSES